MRFLVLGALAVSPTMFAQTRAGARPVVAPVRVAAAPPAHAAPTGPARVAPTPPPRVALGQGSAGQGVTRTGPRPAPVYFLGYYPNPYYYDSGYGTGYATPATNGASAPAYYATDPNGQGYPSVIVNPNYAPDTANPVMHDYSYLPAAGDDAQGANQNATPAAASVVFLIAMKDHTIYPAIAYWVENDTLSYITQQGVRNQISIGLVDRDFSIQLNKERSIDFALPAVTAN